MSISSKPSPASSTTTLTITEQNIDQAGRETAAQRALKLNPEVRVPRTHDVSDEAAVERFVDEVVQAHECGAIHLPFNNADVDRVLGAEHGERPSPTESSQLRRTCRCG